MGGIFDIKNKIKITSEIDIYKISTNVFSYGLIDYDNKYINNICNLLNKGTKFVPNTIIDDFDFFDDVFKSIDNSLVKFNKNIFINKIQNNKNISKNNNNSLNNNTDLSNLNETTDIIDTNDTNIQDKTDTMKKQKNTINNLNKKAQNYANIPVQIETTIFRDDIYKELNKKSKNIINNLTNDELKTLKSYCNNKPFLILRCDKNVGSILISKENELILANKILDDLLSYKKLDSDETSSIINKINNSINKLYTDKNV